MKRFFVFSLVLVSFVSAYCGKKEPPRLPVYERPESPASLKAINREEGIWIAWSYPDKKMEDIEGFALLRAEDGVEFTEMAFVKERLYADRSVRKGALYQYMVAAKALRGGLAGLSETKEARASDVPGPPRGVDFEIGEDSLLISWIHDEGDVFFNVYKSPKKGSYGIWPLNETPLSVNHYSDSLGPESSVYYTVRAFKGGDARDEGGASAEISVGPEDFVPSAPSGLKAVSVEGGVILIWGESPEKWVRGYRVYRSLDGGEFGEIGTTATQAFPDGEYAERERAYVIRALGPLAEGPESAPVYVRP